MRERSDKTEPRLNRAGIPVLDPPGRNCLPKECRMPSDHWWGPPTEIDSDWDWLTGECSTRYEQRCRRCGAVDRYWTRTR